MATPPLRARAAAAKTDQTNGAPSSEIARPNGNGSALSPADNLAGLIAKYRPDFEAVLPKHLNVDRLLRLATVSLRQTPALARCTPISFLGALMTCSQLGLEPGPLGEAYLVPYGEVCTFIPGYRGLVKLAWQSGQLASIAAEAVHEADTFEVHYGSQRRIVHVRPPLGVARGPAIGWYALASFRDGGEAFVVMDRPEVEAIRSRSKAARNGPWVTDFDAMAKKSCVRQLAKWLPLSPELGAALAQDGTVRTDLSAVALQAPGPYVEGEIVPDAPPGVDPATGQITDGEAFDPADPGPDVEDPPARADWPETAAPGSQG